MNILDNPILVTGGRNYGDHQALGAALHDASPSIVIQGGATGADSIARDWALKNGVPMIEMPAQWEAYGKAAGPMRNEWMLWITRQLAASTIFTLTPTVLACPGGRGTADMVRRCQAAGFEIVHVGSSEDK